MDGKEKRRALAKEYKERKKVGGVFCLRNTETGRYLLMPAADAQGLKNRFAFMQRTNSPLSMQVAEDWRRFGSGTFTLECLEELEKKELQSDREFREDIEVLARLWQDRLGTENAYSTLN